MTRSLARRFASKASPEPNTGCWLWTGAIDTKGYGKIGDGSRANHRILSAHRVSWLIAYGEIPAGRWVLHRCDTPLCVNPAHLFLGDAAANNQDCAAKGRNGNGALSPSDVRAIRVRLAAGERQRVLAEEYGVSQTTISVIATGQTWRHLS